MDRRTKLIVLILVLAFGGAALFVTLRRDGAGEQVAGAAQDATDGGSGVQAGISDEETRKSGLLVWAAGSPAPDRGATSPAPGPESGAGAGGGTLSGGEGSPPGQAAPGLAASGIRPPRPGNYRYKRSASGNTPEFSGDVTATVTPTGDTEGSVRQTIALADPKKTFIREVAWKPDQSLTLKWTVNEAHSRSECDWKPDLAAYAFPLREGAEWSESSSCQGIGQGQPFKVDQKGQAKVLGPTTVDVGGKTVDAWTVERSWKRDYLFGANPMSESKKTTELFAPAYGLVLKETTQTTYTAGAWGTWENTSILELLSVDPVQ